jgi:8-oxo-dGTP pyrophosphatase MutT (NUDIX family)
VQKSGDDHLTVRARVAADLDQLRAMHLPELSPTVYGAGTDYPCRATISHEAFGRGIVGLIQGLHYANFKDAVAATQGYGREEIYAEVWGTLLQLEEAPPPYPEPFDGGVALIPQSYGGVVIDDRGRVLLHEPRDHFGGYHWTFPKGRPLPGEQPLTTALREVREEAGIDATLRAEMPGLFGGTTTDTAYFLLSLVAETGEWDNETSAIRWATRGEAAQLIALTTTPVGRERDLQVLDAAFALHERLHPATINIPNAQVQCGATSNTYTDVYGGWNGPGGGKGEALGRELSTGREDSPLLDVTVTGRVALLTSAKSVADDWKWAVARAVADAWRGGYLTEECAVQLTFDLPTARMRDTALANLLKATIDGLSNQIFAPTPGGQPGPWSREDWRITSLYARKRVTQAASSVRIVISTPKPSPLSAEAPLADLFVPGSPPLYPGDQAGVIRVQTWKEAFRQLLASQIHLPLDEASTARICAAFDFAIEPERMMRADLDNFCHPAALATGTLLLGQAFATRNVIAFHGTKRLATSLNPLGTRVRLWREA